MLQGTLSEQEGFDLVHLCATFSANPFIMAFAQVCLLPCPALIPMSVAGGD